MQGKRKWGRHRKEEAKADGKREGTRSFCAMTFTIPSGHRAEAFLASVVRNSSSCSGSGSGSTNSTSASGASRISSTGFKLQRPKGRV
jgi:hypothetical protein